MQKAWVNGINLHYVQTGKGDDVLLIHGLGGNLAVWFLKLIGKLRKQYRFTACDLRGHGRSDTPPTGYTTKDMAEDIKSFLDVLEIEKINVIGHSWGADIAMHLAVLYPEKVLKVIAIEPNIADLIDWRKSKDWEGWAYWAKRLAEFGIHVPKEKWHDVDYMLKQTVHVPIQYGPFKGQKRKKNAILNLLENTTLLQDYEKVAGLTIDKLKGLKIPICALYGENSHFLVTYEYLKEHVPNCKTFLIPGGDHYGPLENPDGVIDRIQEFFN